MRAGIYRFRPEAHRPPQIKESRPHAPPTHSDNNIKKKDRVMKMAENDDGYHQMTIGHQQIHSFGIDRLCWKAPGWAVRGRGCQGGGARGVQISFIGENVAESPDEVTRSYWLNRTNEKAERKKKRKKKSSWDGLLPSSSSSSSSTTPHLLCYW